MIFIICFITIYLVVFIGGWKLFESGDPILIEIGVAFILAIFMTAINEVLTQHQNKIKALEEKIAELYPTLSKYNNSKSPNIQTFLAGIYRKTMIFAMPGSPNAVKTGLGIIIDELGHLKKHATK